MALLIANASLCGTLLGVLSLVSIRGLWFATLLWSAGAAATVYVYCYLERTTPMYITWIVVVTIVANIARTASDTALFLTGVLAVGCVVTGLFADLGKIVGSCLCVFVPRRSGAKWLAAGAAACYVGCAGCLFLALQAMLVRRNTLAGALSSGQFILSLCMAGFLVVGAHFLLTLFLRQLSRFLKDEGTSDYISNYLGFLICVVLTTICMGGLIGSGAMTEWLRRAAELFILVCSLINYVWFLRVVKAGRDLIRWQRL